MRYQNSSALSYVFRNFWHYVYIVLPVAIFMSIFATFSTETAFLRDWAQGNLVQENYVSNMTESFLLIKQADAWWQAIITFVLVVVTFSLLCVKISRHMRIGGFTLLPFKSALKVIPAMFIFCGCMGILLQLLEFAAFGILYALSEFLPMNAVVIIGLAMLFVSKILAVYVWMLLLLSFPLHYSENYKFNVALSYSVREMSKRQWLCVSHALIYAFVHALVVFLDYLLPSPVATSIVYGLFFGLVIYYVPCLAFSLHHDSLGSERKDISKVIIG